MKTRSMYRGIVLIAAALATVACQNELKEEYNEPKPGEKITMTIRATQGAASQTRTDYEDNLGITGIDNIAVKWEVQTVHRWRRLKYSESMQMSWITR